MGTPDWQKIAKRSWPPPSSGGGRHCFRSRDRSAGAGLAAGASLAADFEIGSVSKGITGLLYADALSRGELGPDTTLGERLPLGDCPAAGLTWFP